jgi:hypothetical protein
MWALMDSLRPTARHKVLGRGQLPQLTAGDLSLGALEGCLCHGTRYQWDVMLWQESILSNSVGYRR